MRTKVRPPLTALDANEIAFQRLKAELIHAFVASEAGYKPLSAAEVIDRNRNWRLDTIQKS